MTERFQTEYGLLVSDLEHGGVITSLVLGEKELLRAPYISPNGSLRGGMPIMFPNAGELSGGLYPELPRHGFARNQAWKKIHSDDKNTFIQELISSDETKKIFPHDFTLQLAIKFENKNFLTISQMVINTGDSAMPIAMGLHPYFQISHDGKKNIVWDEKLAVVRERYTEWVEQGETVIIDNPGTFTVEIPNLGTLRIECSPEYRKLWIWSEPNSDFVCIEPAMRDVNGLVDDPEMVAPGATFVATMKISILR